MPLVSRVAPMAARGTAIGVYNTTQSLGLFAGGAIGGWLMQHYGQSAVFVFGMALVALWLLIAVPMRVPRPSESRTYPVRSGADPVALRDRLILMRGVRDAVIMPDRGVAMLTFHPESFDEQAVEKLLGGET